MLSIKIQAQNTFQKLYARTNDTLYAVSGINSVKEVESGNFILAGGLTYCHNCQSHALIIKTDANGDTLWTRKMGGVRDDGFLNTIQLADGNYLFAGETQSFGKQATANIYGAYIYVVKTDVNGDTLWTKIYGGTNTDNAHNNNMSDLQPTLDGGYIILEFLSVSPNSTPNYKSVLIKCNANGDTLWTKMYTATPGVILYNIVQTPADSGYVMVGSVTKSPALANGLVTKLDKMGNVLWAKDYGSTGTDFFSGVATCGSGYVVTGNTASYRGDNYMYTLRLDSVGDTLWSKIYGPIYHNNYFKKQNDSSFVLFGLANSGGILVVKFNAKGTNTYTQVYGTDASIGEPAITADGGYIISGYTIDYGSGYGEGFLIKADAFGNSGCYQVDSTVGTYAAPAPIKVDTLQTMHFPISVNSTQTQITSGIKIGTICSNTEGIAQFANNTQNSTFKIFPNPAQNNFTIETTSNEKQTISIFDVNGKQVLTQSINGTTSVDASHLNAGVYNVNISNSSSIVNKKVVIVR